MPTCQHLIYKRAGQVAECGRTANHMHLDKHVCTRHSPDCQATARKLKQERDAANMKQKTEALAAFIQKVKDETQ